MDNPDVSVVIPVYRSEQILPALLDRLSHALSCSPILAKHEIILINDCSPDSSWRVIMELCEKYVALRAIDLRKNVGQHNAIMAGLKHARGKVIVVMDDDLQHAPEDISALVHEIRSGHDACYASFAEKSHAKWKVLGSRFNDWTATLLLGKPRNVRLSAFKALSAEIVQEVVRYTGPFVYIDGIVLTITPDITNVTVQHHPRRTGRGNYGVISSLFLWTKMATNFSVVPLRLASLAGLFFSALGIAAAILLTMIHLFSTAVTVPGWSSLIVVTLVVGGIQLLALGAIGEYLGRAYVHLNRAPQYVIRNTCGFADVAGRRGALDGLSPPELERHATTSL